MKSQSADPHLNASTVRNQDISNQIAEKQVAVKENNYLSKSMQKILNRKEMKKLLCQVKEDVGPHLVMQKVLITPRLKGAKEWLRHNVFQTTYTIGDQVCKLIIDSRSCQNFQKRLSKTQLPVEKCPSPSKLSWLKKG